MMGDGFSCATFTTSPGIFLASLIQDLLEMLSRYLRVDWPILAVKKFNNIETKYFYCRGWGWGIKIT